MIAKLTKLIFFSFLLLLTGSFVHAQESLTLSISPTLFDMSAEPGQSWQSNIRVVNVNKYELTVYAEVVNFAPKGEGGDGRFIPIVDGSTDNATLAEWFTITTEPIVVPPEQTKEIPFTVTVPADASPGGHFAAILVGTRPINKADGESKIQTAQMVTSLFFAKVAGDVIESGAIREFTTEETYLNSPEVTFSLRFENKGNVHLQPQGEIKIYNMWGHERGILPINQYSNFGNVLPESIRKFVLSWKGEWSISEIGRYRAIATLGYGTDARQFTSAETYFWVIPFKLIISILTGLFVFFVIISWLVRLYIRHVLALAGISVDEHKQANLAHNQQTTKHRRKARLNFHAPLEAGILDLSKRLEGSTSFNLRLKTILGFIKQYRLFFTGVSLFLLFIGLVIWYLLSVNTEHRAYEVLYRNNESATVKTSEDILYEQLLRSSATSLDSLKVNEELPSLGIVNRSGMPGLGAKSKLNLQKMGYRVLSLEADFNSTQKKTVIVSSQDSYEKALELSKLFNNALVSLEDTVNDQSPITIYLGEDTLDD